MKRKASNIKIAINPKMKSKRIPLAKNIVSKSILKIKTKSLSVSKTSEDGKIFLVFFLKNSIFSLII